MTPLSNLRELYFPTHDHHPIIIALRHGVLRLASGCEELSRRRPRDFQPDSQSGGSHALPLSVTHMPSDPLQGQVLGANFAGRQRKVSAMLHFAPRVEHADNESSQAKQWLTVPPSVLFTNVDGATYLHGLAPRTFVVSSPVCTLNGESNLPADYGDVGAQDAAGCLEGNDLLKRHIVKFTGATTATTSVSNRISLVS